MLKNYAHEIRKKFATTINALLYTGITLEESILLYVNGFYELDNVKDPSIYYLKSLILNVAFLDAYKIYSYKQKEGLTNEGEQEFLGILMDLEDNGDLLSEAINDPEFLKRLLAASYEFSELGDLEKILIMKSLSFGENLWLSEKSELHEMDIDEYNQTITLETLKTAFCQKKMQQMIVGGIDFEVSTIMTLMGFVRNLVKLDFDNAKELLLQIANIDYAANVYLNSKGKDEMDIMEAIRFYENSEKDLIIYQLMSDQDFLKEALWSTLDVLLNREYQGVKLSEEVIQTKESEMFQKKLNLNIESD